MCDDNKLKSTLIYGNSRTYFFDVKISPEGYKYLVIQDNKMKDERRHISIGEENIIQFIKALHQLLPEFGIESLPKEDFTKTSKIWTSTEDEALKRYALEGMSLIKLSEIFKRKKTSIQARLNKLK